MGSFTLLNWVWAKLLSGQKMPLSRLLPGTGRWETDCIADTNNG